jgi:hypothetical protein
LGSSDKVTRFITEIFQHGETAENTIKVDIGLVRRMVATDPDTAAAVVLARCMRAEKMQKPSLLQLAMIVAAAYQAEFHDDSLVLNVQESERTISKGAMPPIEFDTPEEQPISTDAVRILEIAPEDLRSCNINHVVELLSIDWADDKKLLDLLFLWGKCVLTFPVDDDPRPVTRIPEVRQFIQRLNNALPYFPCYLDFHPDFGMFIMYFSCLAQESALLKEGISLNINDASVISSLLEAMRSVGEVAARMQLDPKPTWHAMLSPYPPEFFLEMLEKLQ